MNSQYSIFNIQYSARPARRGFTPTPVFPSLRFSEKGSSLLWTFSKNLRLAMRSVGALKQWQNRCRGFTLVEMIVAIGLFTLVLFIASSAFLAVVNADRKSRATRTAMDNLNLALEDMSRRIKTGTAYYCGTGGETDNTTKDCVTTVSQIFFNEQGGARTSYYLDANGVIRRSSGGVDLAVTSVSEVTINDLRFIVGGSTKWDPTGKDVTQPYAVILIDGTTKTGKVTSGFNIQTMVTQRAYDI